MKFLIMLFFICITIVSAQTEKLIINAKNFEASEQKNISTFTDDVEIKMGKDKLNAQKVNVFFQLKGDKKTKTPSKLEAFGDVSFEIVSDIKHYIGKGDKIIYDLAKQEYIIEGNGFLQEKNDDRKIYGDKIYVNQLTGEAKVSGSDDKPVKFIINIDRSDENKGTTK
jgi:lipopolysaccharide export system protein LptA